jgi:hypothetical protein
MSESFPQQPFNQDQKEAALQRQKIMHARVQLQKEVMTKMGYLVPEDNAVSLERGRKWAKSVEQGGDGRAEDFAHIFDEMVNENSEILNAYEDPEIVEEIIRRIRALHPLEAN